MHTRLICILPLLFGMAMNGTGQHGIRLGMGFESVARLGNMNIILGADHELRDKLSVGLDLIVGATLNNSIPTSGYGNNAVVKNRLVGLQYNCNYFLGEFIFIGSTLGIRSVRSEGSFPYRIYDPAMYTYTTHTITEERNTLLFPLGIRFGFQTERDALYYDLHLGIGYTIGSARSPFMASNAPVFSPLWLTLGYAIGLGW